MTRLEVSSARTAAKHRVRYLGVPGSGELPIRAITSGGMVVVDKWYAVWALNS